MGSTLPTEKLERTNYMSWEYKMYQYLDGQGYWSYIQGAHENQPDSKHANYPAWEQAASRSLRVCEEVRRRRLPDTTPVCG